jgi:hypothetical protein
MRNRRKPQERSSDFFEFFIADRGARQEVCGQIGRRREAAGEAGGALLVAPLRPHIKEGRAPEGVRGCSPLVRASTDGKILA